MLNSKMLRKGIEFWRKQLLDPKEADYVYHKKSNHIGDFGIGMFDKPLKGSIDNHIDNMIKRGWVLSGSRAFDLNNEKSDWDFFTTDEEEFERTKKELKENLTQISDQIGGWYMYHNTYDLCWFKDSKGRELQISLVSELLDPKEAEMLSKFKKVPFVEKYKWLTDTFGEYLFPKYEKVEKYHDACCLFSVDGDKLKVYDQDSNKVKLWITDWSPLVDYTQINTFEKQVAYMLGYLLQCNLTHNGLFHADEVFAIAIIDSYRDTGLPTIRTRNKVVLEAWKNDENRYVVDVGGEYDPKMNNFDHHQNKDGIDGKSSAGLILERFTDKRGLKYLDDIVSAIDAQDIGAKRQEAYGISNIISLMNKADIGSKCQEKAFAEAVYFAKNIINGAREKQTIYNQNVKDVSELEIKEINGYTVGFHERHKMFLPVAVVKEERKDIDILVQYDNQQSCWTVQVIPQKDIKLNEIENDNIVFVHKAGFIAKVKGLDVLDLLMPKEDK